jgi:hypothetical protein
MFGGVVALGSGMSHPSKECRYLCSELVSVVYEDHSRAIHQAVGNLEEISSTGATILFEERLESGLPLSFHAKGYDLYGIVESSDIDDDLGWFVKVKLESTSRWSGRMFVPAHFLALCASAFSPEAEAVAMSTG